SSRSTAGSPRGSRFLFSEVPGRCWTSFRGRRENRAYAAKDHDFLQSFSCICLRLELAHFTLSRRFSDSICFLGVVRRVDNVSGRLTLDPFETSVMHVQCGAPIAWMRGLFDTLGWSTAGGIA